MKHAEKRMSGKNTSCNREGDLGDGGGQSVTDDINYMEAYSRELAANHNPDCRIDTTATGELCIYSAVPYCANTTTPAFMPPYVYGYRSNDWAFDISSSCIQVNSGPLICYNFTEVDADKEYPTDPGPMNHCTTILGQ